MRDECIKRMELLKLSRQCINAFKSGKVWESEGIGALYEVDDEEQKIINNFEKENGAMVYHIIHNVTDFGELYTILYVSKDKEEWQKDIDDIKENIIFAYVYNKDDDFCSEFGSICFKSNIGGLVRVA
jgi:hypothetical protein